MMCKNVTHELEILEFNPFFVKYEVVLFIEKTSFDVTLLYNINQHVPHIQ